MAANCKNSCSYTASILVEQACKAIQMKAKDMTLAENVRALREANGWGTPALAKAVNAAGAKSVRAAHIQQLERGTKPSYIRELAAAFGKTVDDLYNWRPGMPPMGPNDPASGAAGGKLTPELMVNRYEHDVDQLRMTLLTVLDVITAKIPGAAAVLARRLTSTAEAFPDPQYGDKGFHARLVGTLRLIAQSEEAADTRVPQHASRAPSARRRAT
jgi:hypothetical protein